MKRTILFWRKYLQIFPNRVQEVFRKIATNDKGPLSGIISCLNKLGNVTPLGYWNTHHFGVVNWLTTSQKWLCYIIDFEWKFHACKQLQGRQHFLATMVDSESFSKNVAKFNHEEQSILKNHAGGTQYTHDAKSHFDPNTSDQCPFCKNHRDTRTHRILDCPVLAPCRTHFNPKVWKELRGNETLRHFALLPMDPVVCSLRKMLINPWPKIQIQFRHKMHIFTDGSFITMNTGILPLQGRQLLCLKMKTMMYRVFHTVFFSLLRITQVSGRKFLRHFWQSKFAPNPPSTQIVKQFLMNGNKSFVPFLQGVGPNPVTILIFGGQSFRPSSTLSNILK